MTTTATLVNRHTAGLLLAPARPAYGPGGGVVVHALAPFIGTKCCEGRHANPRIDAQASKILDMLKYLGHEFRSNVCLLLRASAFAGRAVLTQVGRLGICPCSPPLVLCTF